MMEEYESKNPIQCDLCKKIFPKGGKYRKRETKEVVLIIGPCCCAPTPKREGN
jgi:hypothetical protein